MEWIDKNHLDTFAAPWMVTLSPAARGECACAVWTRQNVARMATAPLSRNSGVGHLAVP